MVLEGKINYVGDGLSVSTRAMVTQLAVINVHTDNISNFGVPGYQRKDPVVTSFAEYLGPNAVDKVTSTEIGRIRQSGNPLDFALNTKGYFQKLNTNGSVELSRDGRMKLDKDGTLCALDGKKILSNTGIPLKFSLIPANPAGQVKVSADGMVTVYDPSTGKTLPMGKIGVVSEEGSAAAEVDLKQGYVEDSNVYLQNEFVSVIPLRRNFEANRQLFILQSDGLSRMIQELGRTQ